MIRRETRMLLRHYLEQGASKSALARRLGISRHHSSLDPSCGFGSRPRRSAGALRAATGVADEAVRLQRDHRGAPGDLSAAVGRVTAGGDSSRGVCGPYTQLKAFVRQVRPLPTPEPVICFETPARRQAQVDFARFRFPWGLRYALLVMLGYSRLLWCRFYPRQDIRTLLADSRRRFSISAACRRSCSSIR